MTQFEARLNECLEALREGRWDLDACLRHYPDDAAALRPLLIAAAATANAFDAIQPREAFARSARERFLIASGQRLQEAMDVDPEPSFFAAARMRFLLAAQRLNLAEQAKHGRRRIPLFGTPVRALGGVMAALVLFLSFSTYTVASASNAIPGDWQYPVKLQTERVRLALALSDGSKRGVKLDIAEERVNEIQEMAQRHKIIGPGVLNRLVEQTQTVVDEAKADNWHGDDAARLQAITEKQTVVLGDAATKVDAGAQDELAQAKGVSQAGVEVATQLIYADPARSPVVLAPSIPLTETPVVATPTPVLPPAIATATPDADATPETSPTPGADPTPPASSTPVGIVIGSTAVETRNGVKLYQVTAARLSFLVPGAATDGWHFVFDDTATGVPTLIKLSNGDGTSLVTLDSLNGDMYWHINVNGRFDEVQMRILRKDTGKIYVADRVILRTAWGTESDIPFYILDSIRLAPVVTPTPEAPAPASPTPTAVIAKPAP